MYPLGDVFGDMEDMTGTEDMTGVEDMMTVAAKGAGTTKTGIRNEGEGEWKPYLVNGDSGGLWKSSSSHLLFVCCFVRNCS